ncbi:MAG: D-cysteine desulfhydrase family protein [Polyangiaceae bacterium]|nr:D-cysteine desulfhydrase family protein [Polyangiaceae bacterium]
MKRVRLAFTPTPIVHSAALDALVGAKVFVKRDDMTGGAEAGNKIRKLEYLVAEGQARSANVLLTCGAVQSNHARATAIVAARLGLRAILFLRTGEGPTSVETPAPKAALPTAGNALLDRLVGAEIRLVSAAEYATRDTFLEAEAERLRGRGERPYVIPEGGSNGLGALGYVQCAREVREQVDLGLVDGAKARAFAFDEVAVACGSGGTVAGLALGAPLARLAPRVRSVSVCDDAGYFRRVVGRIVHQARGYDDTLQAEAELCFDDAALGPRYGAMSDDQRAFLVRIARGTGLLLDPVYSGKALYAVHLAAKRGELSPESRVLFIHTGGLPGLLAEGAAFAGEL